MTDHDCTICHTEFDTNHTIIRPTCGHPFHAICMHIWLANHHRCPTCKSHINLSTELPNLEVVFTVALAISRELALEQATYTYACLSLFLKRFSTKSEWKRVRETLAVAVEQFEVGTTRLPYLNLSTRSSAKQEKQKWAELFTQISDGETVRGSPRIRSAKRWILDRLFFMFQD